jgi:hypothetical protein
MHATCPAHLIRLDLPCLAPFAALIMHLDLSSGEDVPNQTGHVLTDRRRHSNILDVRSFRGTDCDTDHHLVVEKVRKKLEVSKRAVKKTDMKRFNLKKLHEGGR